VRRWADDIAVDVAGSDWWPSERAAAAADPLC
jgi:hypothetical protein